MALGTGDDLKNDSCIVKQKSFKFRIILNKNKAISIQFGGEWSRDIDEDTVYIGAIQTDIVTKLIVRGDEPIDLFRETPNSGTSIHKHPNRSAVIFARFDDSNEAVMKNRKGGKRRSVQGRHDWVGA
jgi:hypothetical protein